MQTKKPALVAALAAAVLMASFQAITAAASPTGHEMDGILAVVNEKVVLESEVRSLMQASAQKLASTYTNNPGTLEKKLEELRSQTLEQLVERALILDEAEGLVGLRPDAELLRKTLWERIQSYGDTNTFLLVLAAKDITPEEFKLGVERELIVQARRRFKLEDFRHPTVSYNEP